MVLGIRLISLQENEKGINRVWWSRTRSNGSDE
jgi:hypothetical protein